MNCTAHHCCIQSNCFCMVHKPDRFSKKLESSLCNCWRRCIPGNLQHRLSMMQMLLHLYESSRWHIGCIWCRWSNSCILESQKCMSYTRYWLWCQSSTLRGILCIELRYTLNSCRGSLSKLYMFCLFRRLWILGSSSNIWQTHCKTYNFQCICRKWMWMWPDSDNDQCCNQYSYLQSLSKWHMAGCKLCISYQW